MEGHLLFPGFGRPLTTLGAVTGNKSCSQEPGRFLQRTLSLHLGAKRLCSQGCLGLGPPTRRHLLQAEGGPGTRLCSAPARGSSTHRRCSRASPADALSQELAQGALLGRQVGRCQGGAEWALWDSSVPLPLHPGDHWCRHCLRAAAGPGGIPAGCLGHSHSPRCCPPTPSLAAAPAWGRHHWGSFSTVPLFTAAPWELAPASASLSGLSLCCFHLDCLLLLLQRSPCSKPV